MPLYAKKYSFLKINPICSETTCPTFIKKSLYSISSNEKLTKIDGNISFPFLIDICNCNSFVKSTTKVDVLLDFFVFKLFSFFISFSTLLISLAILLLQAEQSEQKKDDSKLTS